MLEFYKSYTRKDVQELFCPDDTYTAGAGKWGLSGIVCLNKNDNDFVLFVNLHPNRSKCNFDEKVTENGILFWQSQLKQKLNCKTIKKFINHDETINDIHLFMRLGNAGPYKYIGKLAYITHNNSKECPVDIKWQILDWDKKSFEKNFPNVISKNKEKVIKKRNTKGLFLTEAPVANKQKRNGVPAKEFHSYNIDFVEKTTNNTKLGEAGEIAVLEYEKECLKKMGKFELAKNVYRTNAISNTAPYDINSFDFETGERKYIEVKTTTGNKFSRFYISAKELKFSIDHKDNYCLYRVFDFNEKTKSGNFYIKNGSLEDICVLKPTNYLCELK